MNCPPLRTKQKRYMHVLMTASSTMKINTRIWMNARYVKQRGIRSGAMILVTSRVNCPRKKIPAKVMWYAPIIPRLKCLFRNKDHTKLLQWHKEDRKVDNMLRHLADGSQWRVIDREFLEFANEARNLRFALSTDGMNPFGKQSTSHSTWPVTLCIYNLPSWLCMKQNSL